MTDALRALLRGLIDYAGLFPPASLGMPAAIREYAAGRAGPEADWLGRFVVPAARLEEMASAVAALAADPGTARDPEPGPWRLSALVGADAAGDFRAIRAFNRREAVPGAAAGLDAGGAAGRPPRLVIDALEMKAETSAEVESAMAGRPEGVTAYFEIPIQGDPQGLAGLIAAIGRAGGRAKVRTGGVTADLIPPPEALARFLAACARAGVPFKATAGLHHPFRSLRPLTYAPDSPRARMHGFLNVFLAAAFAAEGADAPTLAALLAEEDPAAFRFRDGAAEWRGRVLPAGRLAEVRRDFSLGFGSCSIAEPREDLSEAGLL